MKMKNNLNSILWQRSFFSIIALLSLFAVQGCLFSEDSKQQEDPKQQEDSTQEVNSSKTLHVLNPWPEGSAPFLHGDFNDWETTEMTKENDCGWYEYVIESNLGDFRILKDGKYNDLPSSFGKAGLASETNLNIDSLLTYTTDVWVFLNADSISSIIPVQPYNADCAEGSSLAKPAAGQAEFPFPQDVDYEQVIQPTFFSWSQVQKLYEEWKANLFEESGDLARIKLDDPEYTSSHAIGYGMLILVFMDNQENNTRESFDKLWAYYQNFINTNGLMNRKTVGFRSVVEEGSEAEADLDVAMALAMAWAQWGDDSYKEDALKLIEKIKEHELKDTYILVGDNRWQVEYPANTNWAALQTFALIDTANADYWNLSISTNYQDPLKWVVLRPDLPIGFQTEFYRACWDYLWHENAGIADEIAENGAQGLDRITNGNVLLFPTNFSERTIHDPTMPGPELTGPFTVSAMTYGDQEWLDALYALSMSQTSEEYQNYSNSTWQLLSALLITGNMPNMLAP